jgi:AcrR family transcriptional regulator
LYSQVVPDLPDHLQSTALGTQKVSREVMSEHQRERVLREVTAVFAKRGYVGATVDDLLAAGKVGVTNFYSLFEGKEDCFLTAFDRVVADARERISQATESSGEWGVRICLGLRALIEGILAEPLAARLALVEAQGAGAEALSRYNALLDEAIEWLRGGREHYPEARALPAGFEQSAVSGLAFYLQQCLIEARAHEVEELFEEAAGLVLEAIVGASELRRLTMATAAVG